MEKILKCKKCDHRCKDTNKCNNCNSTSILWYCKQCETWKSNNKYVHNCERINKRRILKKRMKEKKNRIKERIKILLNKDDSCNLIKLIKNK